MSDETKKVILLIADISGYTSYMIAHRTTLAHGQIMITELLEAIIKQAELPVEISKLEGDAVFMYAAESAKMKLEEIGSKVGEKLTDFFDAFFEKLCELVETRVCGCTACVNLPKLKLKMILHAGEALFHKVGDFSELSGVDVITLHRLLKNGVKSDQYILMTESAHSIVDFGGKKRMAESSEEYADIGKLKTFVYFMEADERLAAADETNKRTSFFGKISHFLPFVTNTFLYLTGFKRSETLKDVK